MWRSILIAILANLGFKGVLVSGLGGTDLGRRVAVMFATKVAVGLALLAWWPE